MAGRLEGKVAIVTGGGRGIGRGECLALAAEGAKIVCNDFGGTAAGPGGEKGPADQVVDEVKKLGSDAVANYDNVADFASGDRMVQQALDSFGRLDIVVNNAGYTWDGMAHKMSDEQFRAMLDIHTVAPFRLLRAAAPYLREAGKADREAGREVFRKVVNVTSISGTQGNVGQVNYAAAKAGLVGLTKTFAREWGPFKVNVNAVAFGFVETRLTAALEESGETIRRGEAEIRLGIPEKMRELAGTLIPLGRPATPQEAAGPIFFLCSPWSNFVHGQVLTASGGQMTGMTE